MALKGCKFVFIPDVLAQFNYHGSNYSSSSAKLIENMGISEVYVLKTHFDLLKHRRLFDWYNYRRRKAKIFGYTARNYILSGHDAILSLKYVLLAFYNDPLFFVPFVIRILTGKRKYFTLEGRAK
jgi:hypothetical protein